MADDWERGFLEFDRDVGEKTRAVFLGVAAHLQRSITHGSDLTGAPGQPVQTGNLQRSWGTTFPAEDKAEIVTNVEYAPAIEDGVGPHGPLTLRSPVGGFHSVAKTIDGFDRIVDAEVRAAGGQA
jgi:hypothetical protein